LDDFLELEEREESREEGRAMGRGAVATIWRRKEGESRVVCW
jgi:hypothetical protein